MLKLALAGLALVGCSQGGGANMPSDHGAWTTVAKSSFVVVATERALYDAAESPHFFIHVRITNTSASEVGVDLRKHHEVLYPNQWGASATEHRGAIDERRLVFPPLDAQSAAAIVADFHAGALTRIAAGASLDYYDEFNASGRADVDAEARAMAFVVVSIDGQLRLSDGATAERVTPLEDDKAHEISVPAPVAWKRIPPGARVIVDR